MLRMMSTNQDGVWFLGANVQLEVAEGSAASRRFVKSSDLVWKSPTRHDKVSEWEHMHQSIHGRVLYMVFWNVVHDRLPFTDTH